MNRRTLCLTCCLGVIGTPVVAVCPSPAPRACSLFFNSEAVFVAKVLSRTYADNDENIRFEVRVSRVLRGDVKATTAVYTGNDSGRLAWDVGREYVVFAGRRNGRLWSGDDCGPLTDPTKVRETLKEIEELRHVSTSSVEGEVLSGLPASPGVPGVIVRAKGNGQTYEGKSNQQGKFRIEVPPGRYDVAIDDRFVQYDINELTHGTTKSSLVAGQCGQFQFVRR
jgi:hypothetical protein